MLPACAELVPLKQGWNKKATVEYVLRDFEASLEDCKMCVPKLFTIPNSP